MVSLVIGSEFFVAGLLYGGFDKGKVIIDKSQTKNHVVEALSDGNTKLIVIEKGFVTENERDFIDKVMEDLNGPMIIEIDGFSGNRE